MCLVLSPSLAVDELAKDVRMPGVARGLLEQMCDDPSEIDDVLTRDGTALRIETGVSDYSINSRPGRSVALNHRCERVLWRKCIVRYRVGLLSKARQDPPRFGARRVLDQPQQCGVAPDQPAPRRGVIEPGDLPDQ